MAYESRRYRVAVEIHHHVASHYHAEVAAAKPAYYRLEHIMRVVEVIGVKLHCKSSAMFGKEGAVPAASYAEVLICRYLYELHAGIFDGFKQLECPVGRFVVNDYNVEFKIAFLRQR